MLHTLITIRKATIMISHSTNMCDFYISRHDDFHFQHPWLPFQCVRLLFQHVWIPFQEWLFFLWLDRKFVKNIISIYIKYLTDFSIWYKHSKLHEAHHFQLCLAYTWEVVEPQARIKKNIAKIVESIQWQLNVCCLLSYWMSHVFTCYSLRCLFCLVVCTGLPKLVLNLWLRFKDSDHIRK